MADEQHQSTDPEQTSVGADASVTNAAAADIEAALNEETLEDQAQDAGTDGDEQVAAKSAEASSDDAQAHEEPSAGDGGPSAEADEDTGPDVEQDEEGVAEVKDHSTKLL